MDELFFNDYVRCRSPQPVSSNQLEEKRNPSPTSQTNLTISNHGDSTINHDRGSTSENQEATSQDDDNLSTDSNIEQRKRVLAPQEPMRCTYRKISNVPRSNSCESDSHTLKRKPSLPSLAGLDEASYIPVYSQERETIHSPDLCPRSSFLYLTQSESQPCSPDVVRPIRKTASNPNLVKLVHNSTEEITSRSPHSFFINEQILKCRNVGTREIKKLSLLPDSETEFDQISFRKLKESVNKELKEHPKCNSSQWVTFPSLAHSTFDDDISVDESHKQELPNCVSEVVNFFENSLQNSEEEKAFSEKLRSCNVSQISDTSGAELSPSKSQCSSEVQASSDDQTHTTYVKNTIKIEDFQPDNCQSTPEIQRSGSSRSIYFPTLGVYLTTNSPLSSIDDPNEGSNGFAIFETEYEEDKEDNKNSSVIEDTVTSTSGFLTSTVFKGGSSCNQGELVARTESSEHLRFPVPRDGKEGIATSPGNDHNRESKLSSHENIQENLSLSDTTMKLEAIQTGTLESLIDESKNFTEERGPSGRNVEKFSKHSASDPTLFSKNEPTKFEGKSSEGIVILQEEKVSNFVTDVSKHETTSQKKILSSSGDSEACHKLFSDDEKDEEKNISNLDMRVPIIRLHYGTIDLCEGETFEREDVNSNSLGEKSRIEDEERMCEDSGTISEAADVSSSPNCSAGQTEFAELATRADTPTNMATWTPDDIENFLIKNNFEENMRLGFLSSEDIEIYEWKRATGMSPICDTDWTRATLRKNQAFLRATSLTSSPSSDSPHQAVKCGAVQGNARTLPAGHSSPPIRPPRPKRQKQKTLSDELLHITEVDCTSDWGGSYADSDSEDDVPATCGRHLPMATIAVPAPRAAVSAPPRRQTPKLTGHLAFRGFKIAKRSGEGTKVAGIGDASGASKKDGAVATHRSLGTSAYRRIVSLVKASPVHLSVKLCSHLPAVACLNSGLLNCSN
ncbi:hypothetical protein FHG87_002510 [Trinorchestia longiramus]|nr:hypothetical protein FHG87_002510 [Trinorchestia longiramus]